MPMTLPGAEDLGPPVSGRSGRPVASYDTSAIGRGIATFGQGMQSAANSLSAVETKKRTDVDQATAFDTERRYLEFSSGQDQKLQSLGDKAQPGAFGFREQYQADYLKSAKQFMATVPAELKPVYDVKLFKSEDDLTSRAGEFERTQRKAYYKTNVDDGLTKIESDLYANPKKFDDALFNGNAYIDSIPDQDVNPIEKDALRRAWKAKAQLASLNGMTPSDRLRALGEAPGTNDVIAAIANTETGGETVPDRAVSGAGAIGKMQVMPDTAVEIAGEIGDQNFPRTPEAQAEYLKDPQVSLQYGTYYYNKMLARYDGDQEAALIAYNGGPQRADRWLASGRDDSVIPQESADYYKKVLGKVKTLPAPVTGPEQPLIVGNAQAKAQGRVGAPDVRGVQPVVIDRFKQVQNAFGASIPIVSGFRDPDRNARAGGAKSSEHMNGNAIDLDVSKLSQDQRLKLIQTASAQGFTGIGVYANSLHLDIGPRRAWGPDHHSGSVPAWAKGVIDQHLAGTAKPIGTTGHAGYAMDPRFADMDYVTRDKIVASTHKDISDQASALHVRQEADYQAYDDDVGLNIELGKVNTRQEIIDDPQLRDADIVKHLNALDSKQKEDGGVSDLTARILAGSPDAAVNSFDGKETAVADKTFDAMLKVAPPDKQDIVSTAFVKATGYIPDRVQAQIKQGAMSTDAGQLAGAMAQADAMQKTAPSSFQAMSGGDDVRNRLADYRHFVNDRGMSGEDAAAEMLRRSDPASKVNREVLKPEADKFLKTLAVGDVTNAYDGWFSAEPGSGVMAEQSSALLAEYREIAADKFYETNGDTGLAKARALAELKTRWNVSNISGAPNVMRMPPEMHYPAEGGKYEYLRDDAMKTATDFAKTLDRKVENVTLWPTDQTRADIENGRLPRYRLFYQYEHDGQPHFDEVPGLWGVDASTIKKGADAQGEAFKKAQAKDTAILDVGRTAEQKAQKTYDTTVGPAWMKARAAEAERERGRMEQDQQRFDNAADAPKPEESDEDKRMRAVGTSLYSGSQGLHF